MTLVLGCKFQKQCSLNQQCKLHKNTRRDKKGQFVAFYVEILPKECFKFLLHTLRIPNNSKTNEKITFKTLFMIMKIILFPSILLLL